MTVEAAMRDVLREGKLSCAAAFRVAQAQGVTPGEVGDLANELDIRIAQCQLGLFGYGPKAQGLHKVVRAAESVSVELEKALRERSDGGNVTCADAWAVAKRLRVPKMEVSSAIEALGLRVTQCQLRCF